MEELPMILGVISQMLTEEEELQMVIEELFTGLFRHPLIRILNLRWGPTDFVGITDYVQHTMARYPDSLFKQHFRISRFAFHELLRRFDDFPEIAGIRPYVPSDVKLYLTLWALANQDSFRAIGDRFGMLKGIVDSTYIRICQPFENFAAYTCRKNFCAIILQVTCDKRLKFTSVSTGWPGSMHDARVFQNSAIGQQLNQLLAGTNYHLLGDQAYPLSDHLMKSYPKRGLNESRRRFNRTLNADRSNVERALGRLKNTCRRLKFLYMIRLDLVPSVIIAACCIHNFKIDIDGIGQDDVELTGEEGEDRDEEEFNVINEPLSGKVKRDRISSMLEY